jgi:hypothetical protein
LTDFPSPAVPALPLFVNSYGPWSAGSASCVFRATNLAGAVATWVANLVAYMPITVPYPYPIKRVWWVTGSTVATTNVDFGIYSDVGSLIYNTGSVAMGTASTVQYVNADLLLDAGRYYLAWTCDNTTSRGYTCSGTAIAGRLMGLLEETTGTFGLPATQTQSAWTRAWGPNVCGFTRTSSGF